MNEGKLSLPVATVESPSGDFTFFPDFQEAEGLAIADTESLMLLFNRQPEMVGRFVHELMRVGRYEVVAELSDLVTYRHNGLLFRMSTILPEMSYYWGTATKNGVTEEEYLAFLANAMTVISNGAMGRPYDSELPEDESEWVQKNVAKVAFAISPPNVDSDKTE